MKKPGLMLGQRQRRALLGAVVYVALGVAVAACSGTGALAPATSQPAQPAPTAPASIPLAATQPAQIIATRVASQIPAVAPQPALVVEGATPDRPFGPRTRDSSCVVQGPLPDSACSPGAVFPDVTADQVCRPGYSSSVRNVPAAVSRAVYAEYGIVERTTGEFEVDHLIPLEIGGSNDLANLFPEAAEPRPGFHEKDLVENYLHAQVCAGAMSLIEAQRAIATNWLDVYQRLPQRGQAPVLPTTAPVLPAPDLPTQTTVGLQISSAVGAGPGGRATVTAQTTPGASCSITYRTPAGTASNARGLTAATADARGLAAWNWEIGPSTRPGTGSVVVTCDGTSARSSIQIG